MLLVGLVLCAQTARADVQPLGGLTVADRDSLDVGQEATLCALLGVTYVVAELRPFSAEIAFHWHPELPLSRIS